MKLEKIKPFYRGNLPHMQPVGSTFFVTFRLQGSLPKEKMFLLKKAFLQSEKGMRMEQLIREMDATGQSNSSFFQLYDSLLESTMEGAHHLKNPAIAKLVQKELHRFDGELYDLICYCIMSNHVHILIDTSIQIPDNFEVVNWESLEFEHLQTIMKRIKGPTAIYANRLLESSGRFWQKESYDRYIRDQREYDNVVAYILNNPVKAGLVKTWEEYPFTYMK